MTIHVLQLGPFQTNCYVAVDEKSGEAVVVDPGDCTEELIGLLNDESIKNVSYILLTHSHFDHVCGVNELRRLTGAKVAVHSLDAPALLEENTEFARSSGYIQKRTEPDILLNDGDVITAGDMQFEVMHTPGHTVGGVCYIEKKERVIFSGDTLFCRTVGRTDFPGGSVLQLNESLRRLCALDGDYEVLPGHNRSTTLSSERVKNIYMRRMNR
ncbi:MAG: MBL fold metallo-hydrolase [Clostridiales bacterium]|nr:MBL fold metallo-hydrolase [Clostridiales bacterium]